MKLRNLFTNPVSALILAACAVTAIPAAHADTFVWATWTSDTPGANAASGGTASATMPGFTITYTGQLSGLNGGPSWTPAAHLDRRGRRQRSSGQRYFRPYGRRGPWN